MYTYDPSIEWLLPTDDGEVPYKPSPNPIGLGEVQLMTEVKRLYIFVKDGDPALHQLRRETLFLQMLEWLDAQEAKLLIEASQKVIKGISKKVVEAVFPDIFDLVIDE